MQIRPLEDLTKDELIALIQREREQYEAVGAGGVSLMGDAHAWQPIATAPNDGRTLLLGCFNSLGNWRTMRGQWMSEDYIAECWEEADGVESGWFETAVEADDPPNCWRIEPTHWMPLPGTPCAALTQQDQV